MEYKVKILYYIDKLSLLREDFAEAFRTIKTKYSYDYRDARIAVFTKCANTMNTAFIGFILIREELLDPLWWKEHISELDNTTITRHVEDFEMSIRSAFLNNFFASIESNEEEGKLLDNAMEEILEDEDVKRKFIQNVAELTKAYAVCTPHPACLELEPELRFFQKMRRVMAKSISGISYVPPDKENAVQELVEEGISADEKIRFYNVKYDEEKMTLTRNTLKKSRKSHKKMSRLSWPTNFWMTQ